MRKLTLSALCATALMLSACNNRADDDRDDPGDSPPETGESLTPDPDQPVSIIRPDVEQPDVPAQRLEPLEATIGFPKGGSTLDAAAIAALEQAFEAKQVTEGGAIVLRGHSDAGGTDSANLRASRTRAESVRDWLVEKGIDPSRIRIIAFGEQNPVEPNALPDGSPNETGRSANRRVEVTVTLAQPDAPPIMEEPAQAE